ncbi:TPA: hypothetical protein ACGQ50_000822 [Enterobacter cloacae]
MTEKLTEDRLEALVDHLGVFTVTRGKDLEDVRSALVELQDTRQTVAELAEVARAALAYIDALPDVVVASLPVMPGFDRDWADETIFNATSSK